MTCEIVGWSMADRLRSSLCENALMMAIQRHASHRSASHHSSRSVQPANFLWSPIAASNTTVEFQLPILERRRHFSS